MKTLSWVKNQIVRNKAQIELLEAQLIEIEKEKERIEKQLFNKSQKIKGIIVNLESNNNFYDLFISEKTTGKEDLWLSYKNFKKEERKELKNN